MKRVQVLNAGKVVPGQEEHFKLAAKTSGIVLSRIDARIRAEEPELYKDVPTITDWDAEGADSIISASFRFGDGGFYMEFNDDGSWDIPDHWRE